MKKLESSLMVLTALMTGCVTSHHSAPVSEVYVPATPTSNRAETRVYPETGVLVSGQPVATTPSTNVSQVT
jgi:hypothetical protein